MPKTRQEKEQIVSTLTDQLGRAKSVVFVRAERVPVKDIWTLRDACRKQDAEYHVVKKTLLARALAGTLVSGVDTHTLEGNLAVAFGYRDEVAVPKILATFSKDHEGNAVILGGVLEGRFVDAAAINHLATLPSREELLAKFVGSLHAPVSGFVNVLAGNLRKLLYVLHALEISKS